MKTTEETKKYKEMDIAQLDALLLSLKKELMGNTLKVKAGKMNNFSVVSKAKKNIARINTIISEKEME